MSFTFSADTKFQSNASLMPKGAIHKAMVSVRRLKNSQNSGGEYADIELTLVDGPFEGRKLWPMIPNPLDERNSEKWRQMGMAQIQHALEAAGVFNPANPETYNKYANGKFEDILMDLDNKQVAVKISVEKGTDGHQDKNTVGDWLSPNPNSATSKLWEKLMAGDHNLPASQQTQQPGFSMGNNGQVPAQAAPAAAQQPAQQPAQPSAAVAGNTPAWLNG